MKKKIFSKIFSSMLVVSTLASACVNAATASTDIVLNGSNVLDITLNVGKTSVDYSNFSEDLMKILVANGVKEEDVIINTKIGSSLTTSAFDWWTYDHTNDEELISDENHMFIEDQDIAKTQYSGNYELERHIANTAQGTTLAFHGYGTSAYKDFLYMPNDSAELKNFSFAIEEKEAHDALEGTGFLFNTNIVGSYEDGTQTMSGYLLMLEYSTSGTGSKIKLYSFSDVNTKDFHNTTSTLISDNSKFKLLATAPYSSTDKFRKFKLVTDKNSVKLYYKGDTTSFDNISSEFTEDDLVTFTDSADTSKISTVYNIENSIATSYGFGPIIGYRSHACAKKTNIEFTNVSMVDEKNVSLIGGLNGNEEGVVKFISYLTDKEIQELKDEDTINELKDSLTSSNAYYIGWGTDANETESLNFLEEYKNGSFIHSDDGTTYQEQLEKIAKLIIAKYEPAEEHTTDINVGESTEFNYRNVILTGTDGFWTVVYTDENGEETTTVQDDLSIDTNVAGIYKIYYKGTLLNTVNVGLELDETPKTGSDSSKEKSILLVPFFGLTGLEILK